MAVGYLLILSLYGLTVDAPILFKTAGACQHAAQVWVAAQFYIRPAVARCVDSATQLEVAREGR